VKSSIWLTIGVSTLSPVPSRCAWVLGRPFALHDREVYLLL